ncbi:APC family permease [Streptomyces sp. NPDC052042]|uniref:APC family permease n=1 Tax=Streptomyces sp. NPDC052042 TaxID=3365683 RepID=UPI0037CF4366
MAGHQSESVRNQACLQDRPAPGGPAVPETDGSPGEGRAHTLRGHLGVWSIVFMVVAAAAPLTVVAGVVPLGIGIGNGAAFPLTFVICCATLLLFAVGFTRMTPHVPKAGAFYTYVRSSLGRPMGLGSAYLALATYSAVMLGVYGYIGAATQELVFQYVGVTLPWWLYSAAVLLIVALLGYRHVELSGKVLGVLLICEVGIVVVFDLVVTVRGGGDSGLSTALLQPSQITSGSPGIALMFAIASFLGFEATAVYRDEARDPDRTVPRATYLALLLVGSFYALSSWALVSAWGDQAAVKEANADPGNMLITAVERYLGSAGSHIVLFLLVSSIFAAILSFHNVAARYVFSLANTGALPIGGGSSHPRHGSPHTASLVQSGLSLVMLVIFVVVGMDPVTQIFSWLVGTATLGVLVLMCLTCLAVVVFFRRTRVERNVWATVVAPVLGLAGLLTCLILTLTNFPLLIGGSRGLAIGIEALLATFFVGGFVVAVVRRRHLTD